MRSEAPQLPEQWGADLKRHWFILSTLFTELYFLFTYENVICFKTPWNLCNGILHIYYNSVMFRKLLLKKIHTSSPCFYKETLQSTLEIIWSNILLNRPGYPGSCQAKSWYFPAREISPLLWASYSSDWLFTWWRHFLLYPIQNFSWSNYSHCLFSYHHETL